MSKITFFEERLSLIILFSMSLGVAFMYLFYLIYEFDTTMLHFILIFVSLIFVYICYRQIRKNSKILTLNYDK